MRARMPGYPHFLGTQVKKAPRRVVPYFDNTKLYLDSCANSRHNMVNLDITKNLVNLL